MSKLFLFIIASLLVSLLVLVYHFPSVMLITEHFSSEDTMAGRIQVMRRACRRHRDNLKLSSTYNYTKVDRFSVGGG